MKLMNVYRHPPADLTNSSQHALPPPILLDLAMRSPIISSTPTLGILLKKWHRTNARNYATLTVTTGLLRVTVRSL